MNPEYGRDCPQQDMWDRFNEMGDIAVSRLDQGLIIREGQLFEGKTVKGGKNLIVTLRAKDGWMYYLHGDRAKKVEIDRFVNAVLCGDLEPKLAQDVDVGRLSMAAIALDALANRRSVDQQIDAVAETAEHRFMGGDA